MSSGAHFGFTSAVATMAGCLTALLAMMSISAAGLGALLQVFPSVFEALRWLGAGYLAYLGIKTWRAPLHGSSAGCAAGPKSVRHIRGVVSPGTPGGRQQSQGDSVRGCFFATVHPAAAAEAAAICNSSGGVRGNRDQLVCCLRRLRPATGGLYDAPRAGKPSTGSQAASSSALPPSLPSHANEPQRIKEAALILGEWP